MIKLFHIFLWSWLSDLVLCSLYYLLYFIRISPSRDPFQSSGLFCHQAQNDDWCFFFSWKVDTYPLQKTFGMVLKNQNNNCSSTSKEFRRSKEHFCPCPEKRRQWELWKCLTSLKEHCKQNRSSYIISSCLSFRSHFFHTRNPSITFSLPSFQKKGSLDSLAAVVIILGLINGVLATRNVCFSGSSFVILHPIWKIL